MCGDTTGWLFLRALRVTFVSFVVKLYRTTIW